MKKNPFIFENLHIPFWLLKDFCWSLELKLAGMVMVLPTFTLALVSVYKTRKDLPIFLPNLAIVFWIIANSIWMADEFYNLTIRWVCYPAFGLGLLTIFYWLIVYFPTIWRGN